MDGGSTDGSRELIEKTASQLENQGWFPEQFSGPEDPVFSIANHLSITNLSSPHRLLWCSEKDKGIYNAMNKGIRQATGEYLLFMNSGDCLASKEVISDVYTELEDVGFVIGNVSYVDENGVIKKSSNYVPLLSVNPDFYYYNTTCHQGMFIRSILLKNRPYDENLRIVADWEHAMVEILINHQNFKVINTIVSHVLEGGFSMQNVEKMKKERRYVAEQYFKPDFLDRKYIESVLALDKNYGKSNVATFAVQLAIEMRYDNQTYMDIFLPYKEILVHNGTFKVRFLNWLNMNGMLSIVKLLLRVGT